MELVSQWYLEHNNFITAASLAARDRKSFEQEDSVSAPQIATCKHALSSSPSIDIFICVISFLVSEQ